jgi:hypothetical protein
LAKGKLLRVVHSKRLRKEKAMSQGPEEKIRIGLVSATIWQNRVGREGEDERAFRSVTPARNFRNSAGEWQSSNSYTLADLPAVITVLQRALDYLLEHEGSATAQEEAT